MTRSFTQLLAIDVPLIQAPMAGVSTPELAAAVSNAGGLGSLGLGASSVGQAEQALIRTRTLTTRPFNVNLFCHRPPARDIAVESAWLAACLPLFSRLGAEPPRALGEIYTPFLGSGDMLDLLLAQAPAVVSFHFGLPDAVAIAALHARGILLAATATSLAEAEHIQASGLDIVIAQGFEAGGHRGMFDPQAVDYQTGTLALVQLLKRHIAIPVIAAGGIMDGAGIRAMMTAGADGAQLGTAFLLCPESAADESYRRAIRARRETPTWMTPAISGRPARCIDNDFCRFARRMAALAVPPYPLAYDAGKALAAAARARGEDGFGAHWAGQGINLIREMPAAALVATLMEEYWRATK